ERKPQGAVDRRGRDVPPERSLLRPRHGVSLRRDALRDTTRHPRSGVAFGLFVATETLVFFVRRDRLGGLLWFTRETWLLVLLLWIKDLALAVAAGWIAVRLLSFTKNAVRRAENEPRALSAALEGTLVAILLVAGVVLRWIFRDVCPPGVWV